MSIKKALIFHIMGLMVWLAYSSDVYAKEDIKDDIDKKKVEEFATAYYEAHTAEGMETLADYIEDSDKAALEMIALEECLNSGVEKYDNIDVVGYPLSDGISWLAYAAYDLVVKDSNMYQTEQNETYVVREGDCLWSIVE